MIKQDISASEIISLASCPYHKLAIRFFNINEKVLPSKRVLCDLCDLSSKIRLQEAYDQYNKYIAEQEQSIKIQIEEKTRKWDELKKQIEGLRDNMIKHVNELIQKIDYKIEIIKQQTKRAALPQYEDFSSLKLSELQQIAEELSRQQKLKQQKENLELNEHKDKERIVMPNWDFAPHRLHQIKLEDFQQKLSSLAMKNSANFLNLDLLHQENQKSSFQDSSINNQRNILVGSASKGVIMWRVYQGKLRQIQCYGVPEMINCLLFSKNNNTFISSGFLQRTIVQRGSMLGSYEENNMNYIRIWKEISIDEWKSSFQIQCHSKKINSLLLNREENQIISGSEDSTIQMWMSDNDAWKCRQQLIDHKAGVTALSFNSFQTVFVSSSRDKSLIFWEKKDERSWKQKCAIQNAHDTEILAVCFIFEDRVASGASEMKIWSLDKFGYYVCSQVIQTSSSIKKLIFNQQRSIILEISNQPSMNIWMKKQNGEIYLRTKTDGVFTGPSISSDGKFIIACKSQENMINYYQIK